MQDDEFTIENLLSEANVLLLELKDKLVERVDPRDISLTSKLPFTAMVLREALLYRACELCAVAIGLFAQEMYVSAYIIARAMLETTALLFWLHQKIEEANEAKEVGEVHAFLTKALMGTRNPEHTVSSHNILTAIEKVSKWLPEFKEMYAELSEYAHPNWYGVQGAYSRIDRENILANFGHNSGLIPAISGLSHFVSAIRIFRMYYNKIEKAFPEFVEICEADLIKNPPQPVGN